MSENTVKLGLMPPLTGLVEMYGAEITRAGQIACDEVNESGGVLGRPLELVIEDDGSLPDSAVAAATRLVDRHHCAAIVGNLLSNSRIAVAYRVAEPHRIPYLNFSFYEGSILSHYFFHFAALPNQQIDRMIPYMRERYGSRMFFAGNNYEWPRGSIDAARRALEQAGGQAAGEEYLPIGASDGDIERLLDRVAESGADVFVPYFAGADQIRLLTRFSERGLKKRMAVVMGHYDEVMTSHLPPEVRDGFYSSNTYFMTLDTPENKAYLARLAAQPGVNGIWPQGDGILTNFGEGAYLCVKAFAEAANRAGSLDAEALVEALETIAVSGPQGAVQMDPATHHAQVNTYLSRCGADGSFAIIERFGAIAPALPERYRHLRITKRPSQEDIYLQSRMMAQITEAVLLVHATDGAIVYANPGAERMFGHAPGGLAGRRFSVLFAPSGRSPEEFSASIGATLSRKGVWQGETENIASDGRRFWCAASISAFTHPEHGEVWMILNKDISERRRAEEKNRYLAAIVESSEDAIIGKTLEGVITSWNTGAEKMYGYAADEAIGRLVSILIPPEREGELPWILETIRAGKHMKHFETVRRKKNGEKIYVSLSISPINDAGGNVAGAASVARDISERKQAEERLRTSEALLRRTQALAAIGSWWLDVPRDELVWSDETYRIFGMPAGAPLTYESFLANVHPDDRALVDAAWQAALKGTPYRIQHRIVVHGETRWVEERAELDLDAQGNLCSGTGSVQDITERKRAEETLRRASLYARSLIEASLDPLVTISAEGKITDVNKATEEATGLSRNELIGTDFANYFTEPEKAHAGYRQVFERGFVRDYPLTIRHRAGRMIDVLYNATVYRDETGNILGVFAAARDITERKHAEDEVHRLNSELEQRVAARTAQLEAANLELEEFAYSVAHDLRVPLRAIDGFSYLALTQGEGIGEEGKRLLGVVREHTRKMGQMIDGMLAFTRMGRVEMTVAEIDMDELARAASEKLKPAGRDLVVEIGPLPAARGDLAMLREVWLGLLSNAIKFTRPAPAGRIEVGCIAGEAELVYYVKDNGVGFDPQYAHKLFGVSQRLHGADEFEGSGIGLAIVKRIVARHGGHVWAEGKVGKGATFYFALPDL